MKETERNVRTGATSNAGRMMGMLGILALATVMPVQWAGATSTYSDSFVAPDNTALNGRTMDVGGLIWGASSDLEIVSNRIVQVASYPYDSAGVPFSTSGLVQLSVSADLHPNGGNNWIAIGFGTGPLNPLISDSPLWVLLAGKGEYDVFQNGTTNLLASGTAPNYSSGGFNNVQLSYDTNTTYVTLVVNGSVVLSTPVAGIGVANIASASLELYGQVQDIGVGQVDNFVLATGTSPRSTTSYQDSFAAPDGTPLGGRWPDSGDTVWQASGNLEIEGNHLVQIQNSGVFDNFIDQAALAFRTNGIVRFELSADLHPDHSNWIAIGFDTDPSPLNTLWNYSTLWVLLTDIGAYDVFHNGTATTVTSGTVTPYYPSGFNHVELSYDLRSTRVKLVINGVTLYNSAASGIDVGSMKAAKIMFYQQFRDAVVGQVDNFALTLTKPQTGTVISMY